MTAETAPPPVVLLPCPQCAMELAAESLVPGEAIECPNCRSRLRGFSGPALGRAPAPPPLTGETAAEGEAVCFFHPEKRAATACDRCGRFVCGLCEVPLGARRLCPACLGSGLEHGKLAEIVTSRSCYDRAALLAGLLPCVFFFVAWPFFIVTGPFTIFLALRGWGRPGSITRGFSRGAALTGLLLGVAQLAAWLGMGGFIWWSATR